MEQLKSALTQINAKGYKAYKNLKGIYQFDSYRLSIDHVQGDPYAAPSRISIYVPTDKAQFCNTFWSTTVRRIALEDFLARAVNRAIQTHVKGNRGLGKSGQINIATSGQHILTRNALLVDNQSIEARLTVGLPARGRTILSHEAKAMFFHELPNVIRDSLYYANINSTALIKHIECTEDQAFLRNWLYRENLVTFIANSAHLPRHSGIDDNPLLHTCIAFTSPESLEHTVDLPNAGKITGMGIPAGITLVVGGGFHGKSTLLHAIERGIYNHIPNDGRERVVTDPTAVKVRAEDGRVINDVNINPFINNLPLGKDTTHFSTENGSGSTSQAANIIEALQAGSRLLLIDEDTSATNFMIRDERMQALVSHEKEPITPLLHRVRDLFEQHGISSIIVMGGSGDYFAVSDTVIMLDSYTPKNVSEEAKRIAGPRHTDVHCTNLITAISTTERRPPRHALNPSKGNRDVKIEARGTRSLLYGNYEIDVSRIEQLIDKDQTFTIGLIILYYSIHYYEQTTCLVEGVNKTLDDIACRGLDILSPYKVGHLALPRAHEVIAAINRIRYK